MDLFDYARNMNGEKESPLASRLRPKTLDEVVGQEHIIGKDKLLYRAIKADKISSAIFYGPPGTGKTTLAKAISAYPSAGARTVAWGIHSDERDVRRKDARAPRQGIPLRVQWDVAETRCHGGLEVRCGIDCGEGNDSQSFCVF